MDQHNHQPNAVSEEPEHHRSLEARRRMLRRSLGLASPVVLTLTSAPVSAGMCMSASAFVSANAHMSRSPRNSGDCSGLSPSEWAQSNYWPYGVDRMKKFHHYLSAHVLDHKAFKSEDKKDNNGQPSMSEVLACYETVEAHVAAAWLNARKNSSLPHPFGDAEEIKRIWIEDIHPNGGCYSPGNGLPKMTHGGTKKWLAQAWTPSN